jgi:hypothetical protein
MPWCDRCDRFYNPSSIAPDGTCVNCGHFIAEPPPSGERGATTAEADADAKAPWHFWVLVVAVVVYLGWRLIQGIAWVVQQL